MITLVEALNYRCLRYVHRPLESFHVLVGPNASGKTTFIDVIGFLNDLMTLDLGTAVSLRSHTSSFHELLFRGEGDIMELAIEARIPETLRNMTSKPNLDTVRYEIAIGLNESGHRFEFKAETLVLKKATPSKYRQRSLFPQTFDKPKTILTRKRQREVKLIVNKVPGGNDNFYSEIYPQAGKGWTPSFKLGPDKSALANLPADDRSFPVATWFRLYLRAGVQRFALNNFAIRRPSPPARFPYLSTDGSNLPWIVSELKSEHPEWHSAWIAHLRTALPDLVDITTFERPEDKHSYMIYEYSGGLKVPSWLVSDGTLRLTGLTLPAYLKDFPGSYLIEEPENGIHPKAVTTMYDSLSSIYDAQVLLATHSPVVLNTASRDNVLCFAKDADGATDIVLGSEHPALRQWQGEADLGTLLASGVLG